PGRWHAGCFSSRASQLVRTPEEVMNTNRLILSSLLAASLLSTASLANAHGTRRFKGADDAIPVQRVVIREHSSAAPAVTALIGRAVSGTGHAVCGTEPVYYSHPVVVYRYYDPYADLWYDNLDECHFRYHHPRFVQVFDVSSGRCVRSLRFHDGSWHRFDDDDEDFDD